MIMNTTDCKKFKGEIENYLSSPLGHEMVVTALKQVIS